MEAIECKYVEKEMGNVNSISAMGLPAAYTETEIDMKTNVVFRHIYEIYPVLRSPYYGCKSA